MFGARGTSSPGEVVSLMRLRTQIKPAEMRLPARPYERQATAFTVGFEHEQPAIAFRVANELITMILDEDVRTRTLLASETTRFLERETKKIEGELNDVEAQIADLRRQSIEQDRPKDPGDRESARRPEIGTRAEEFDLLGDASRRKGPQAANRRRRTYDSASQGQ